MGKIKQKRDSEPRKKMPTKRRQWHQDAMILAMTAVQEGTMGTKKASQLFKVPRSTLQDRLHGRHRMDSKLGRKPAMKKDDEIQLVDYACNRASLGIGFGKQQFIRFAGDLAKKKGVQFKNDKPSDKWWRLCKKRNPTLVHRRPEPTASVRHSQMNRGNVRSYFKALEDVLKKNNLLLEPSKIWNMDETGVQLEHAPTTVLAKKGSKIVQTRTSGKRDTITILTTVNAVGKALPPHFVVKGKTVRCLQGFDVGSAPTGSYFSSSDTGWTKSEIALLWFRNVFLKHIGKERPQLLLFDGHDSHNFVQLIEAAVEENIIFVEMPSHTSHWLQPLDRSVFGPLKNYYSTECNNLMTNPTAPAEVNRANFCRLFTSAWIQALSESNIKAGFKACGVYPLNPDAIPAVAYLPNYMHSGIIEHPSTTKSLNQDLQPEVVRMITDENTAEKSQSGSPVQRITQHASEVETGHVPIPVEPNEMPIGLGLHKTVHDPAEDSAPFHSEPKTTLVGSNVAVREWENDSDSESLPADLNQQGFVGQNQNHDEGSLSEIYNEQHVFFSETDQTSIPGPIGLVDQDSTHEEEQGIQKTCSPALALHALNMALGGDKVGKYKSFLQAGIDVPNDPLFYTWKGYYQKVQTSSKNSKTIANILPQPKPATITSKSFYGPNAPTHSIPLQEIQNQTYFRNTSSPESVDSDVLPYPKPKNQDTSKAKKTYGKYFILTADEAVASKRKAAELKLEKERLQEERKRKREQAKENKKTAPKKIRARKLQKK